MCDIYEKLADKVKAQLPQDQVEDLKNLSGVIKNLAPTCKERLLRKAFIRAHYNPNGMYGRILVRRIRGYLPDNLQEQVIVDAIVAAGYWAATNDEIWDMIYPKGR